MWFTSHTLYLVCVVLKKSSSQMTFLHAMAMSNCYASIDTFTFHFHIHLFADCWQIVYTLGLVHRSRSEAQTAKAKGCRKEGIMWLVVLLPIFSQQKLNWWRNCFLNYFTFIHDWSQTIGILWGWESEPSWMPSRVFIFFLHYSYNSSVKDQIRDTRERANLGNSESFLSLHCHHDTLKNCVL